MARFHRLMRDPEGLTYSTQAQALSGHSAGLSAALGDPGQVLMSARLYLTGFAFVLPLFFSVPPATLVIGDDGSDLPLLLGGNLQQLDDDLILEAVAGI